MEQEQQILQLAVNAGELLLQNGGEIFRVQETMERIARAYGATGFHAYVLTNGIFASCNGQVLRSGGEVRHVRESSIHMGRIAAVNELSREIEQGAVPLDDAFLRLKAIRALPATNKHFRVLMCAVGAACFAYLFGGGLLEALAAFGVGAVLQMAALFFERHPAGKIVRMTLLAALVAFTSFCAVSILQAIGLAADMNCIIIGGIIPLVPGVALTTSIRDFAGGDYLSGAIRMLDAFLIGGSIALGVGTVLSLVTLLPGVQV